MIQIAYLFRSFYLTRTAVRLVGHSLLWFYIPSRPVNLSMSRLCQYGHSHLGRVIQKEFFERSHSLCNNTFPKYAVKTTSLQDTVIIRKYYMHEIVYLAVN